MEIRCLISSGFVTFLGTSNEETREKIIQMWRLSYNQGFNQFNIINFLVSETEQVIF